MLQRHVQTIRLLCCVIWVYFCACFLCPFLMIGAEVDKDVVLLVVAVEASRYQGQVAGRLAGSVTLVLNLTCVQFLYQSCASLMCRSLCALSALYTVVCV